MLTRETKHDSTGTFSRRLQSPRASWDRAGASIGQAVHRAHLPCRSRRLRQLVLERQTRGRGMRTIRRQGAHPGQLIIGQREHPTQAGCLDAARASPGRPTAGTRRRCQRISCVSSTVHFRSKRSFRSSPLMLLDLQAVCMDPFRLQNRSRGRIKPVHEGGGSCVDRSCRCGPVFAGTMREIGPVVRVDFVALAPHGPEGPEGPVSWI